MSHPPANYLIDQILTDAKKIRELKQMLKKAGFIDFPGKGSHNHWLHPLYAGKITLSGKDGADAKRYQEQEVKTAIEEVRRKEDEKT